MPPEPIGEGGDDALAHGVRGLLTDGDDDRDRHAPLAGRAVDGAHQQGSGLVEVGVGYDDHVVLGAAECLDALAVGSGRLVDVLGDEGGADEADRLDVVVREGCR
jgi:hypothetical protein